MSELAIRVENLSKRYRIGAAQERHDTLREALTAGLRAPLERLRRDAEHGSSGAGHDDTIWALKDVSFDVKRGEVVGIIGRNGAGKSTLLKILSRITEPTEGRAVIHGRVGSLLEVGTGFHQELTGRENIYLSGAILGMSRAEIDRKFDEIVDFSGVEKFIDTPIKRYSSGMNVRLGFAVAAHLEPEILLVDEVLAVGDAAFQKKCLGKMGEVAGLGRTVLFVSHNMNAITQLCGRTILVANGRIGADGLARDVVSEYLDQQRDRRDDVSLSHWPNAHRPRPFFRKVKVNGIDLPSEVVVPMRGRLEIRIHGDTRGILAHHFRAGVHIDTRDGIRILSYATPWSEVGDDVHIEGRAVLVCIIPSLPLVPGTYYVSVGCMDAGGQMDWLEGVCGLTVAPEENNWGSLLPSYKTHGYYLAEAQWRLDENS